MRRALEKLSPLRILPLLLVLAAPVAGSALAQQAMDPPTRLPPERPESGVATSVPETAAEPAPANQADQDEEADVVQGEDEADNAAEMPTRLPPSRPVFGITEPVAPEAVPETAAEPAPVRQSDEDTDVVEGEDEMALEAAALAADAALRRPSFDEAEARLCEQQLREMGAGFEVMETVGEDEPNCGAERGVALSSVAGISIEPAVVIRCEIGLAFAIWTKDVVVPMAKLYLNDQPTAIGTSGSYECRWRRGGTNNAAFSQHAFANAIDVASIAFVEREPLQIRLPEENSDGARLFQASIRGGACAYFTTVLGPMTNAAHADHLHFDMAERRGGFRLCE